MNRGANLIRLNMAFSPARVIARLLSSFTPDFSPPTRKEIAVADAFKGLLQSAAHGDLECEEEDEVLQVSLDERVDVNWTPDDDDDSGTSRKLCTEQKSIYFDGRPIPEDTIKRAVDFYRATDKGTRSLSCMSRRFTWIRTAHHMNVLREFEKRKQVEETKIEKFKKLSALLRESVLEAAEQALPLSYAIVRQMAVRLNFEHNLIDGFRASESWIANFVRESGLRSRKVTRFVTTRSLRSREDVEKEAECFVRHVREEMKEYPLSLFANADQTGITKELASNRYVL